MQILDSMKAVFGDRIQENKDISHYLTLRTKTVAALYLEVETKEDFQQAVKLAHESKTPIFILGGGSNLAILENKIEALVIRNRYIKKEILKDTPEYADVLFSGGYPMGRVVKETIAEGLSGFEYHLGLPGTIGGAIYMNSKWTKHLSYCGDNLISADIIGKTGELKTVNRDYFEFAYDYSILQKTGEIFLDGIFHLKKEDPEILKQRAKEALEYRHKTQPHGVNTGGCFFQNISKEQMEMLHLPTTSAGYLIDKAGLKGTKIGSFVVSDLHANFIINTGEGKPEDLKELLAKIKSVVKEKYGVELREEVVVI